ncbi:MAG TPA: sugar phosphate isomerase/epimerase [Gaiella sp.]|jgi:sugar phosphate isomerase/epimerase
MTEPVRHVPAHAAFSDSISFMSANYVAREIGYGVADEWGPCDDATNAAFSPVETFAERFDDLLARVRDAGFERLDLWTAHLNWRWATPEHLLIATQALERHGLRVVSLAGSFGTTPAELASACRVATAVGTSLLGGMAQVLTDDCRATAQVLREHGVRFGLENHPERSPAEVLAKIGDDVDVLGTTVDTGWYATHGYDPARAIRELDGRILHVHLKDVECEGTHVTCRYGAGVARIAACVDELVALGYQGAVSVEHEPYEVDPTEECVEMLAMLRTQLGAAAGDAPRA